MHEHGLDKWVYTRELARLANVSTSTASTECRKLAKQGILRHKAEGREKSYKVNLSNPTARKLYELFETERREEFYTKNRRLAWALQDFAKCVFDSLPQIQFVVLFGSAARAELTKTSDVDILAVVPTMEQGEFNKLMKAIDSVAAEIRATYGSPLSVVTMTMKDWEAAIRDRKRIAQDVMREGIVLFGDERYYNLLSKVISQ
jgi:predicted nucleotidyltransferase/predicted transcriptional regulator